MSLRTCLQGDEGTLKTKVQLAQILVSEGRTITVILAAGQTSGSWWEKTLSMSAVTLQAGLSFSSWNKAALKGYGWI